MNLEKENKFLSERREFLKERLLNKFNFMDTFKNSLSVAEKKKLKSEVKILKKKISDIQYQKLYLELKNQ